MHAALDAAERALGARIRRRAAAPVHAVKREIPYTTRRVEQRWGDEYVAFACDLNCEGAALVAAAMCDDLDAGYELYVVLPGKIVRAWGVVTFPAMHIGALDALLDACWCAVPAAATAEAAVGGGVPASDACARPSAVDGLAQGEPTANVQPCSVEPGAWVLILTQRLDARMHVDVERMAAAPAPSAAAPAPTQSCVLASVVASSLADCAPEMTFPRELQHDVSATADAFLLAAALDAARRRACADAAACGARAAVCSAMAAESGGASGGSVKVASVPSAKAREADAPVDNEVLDDAGTEADASSADARGAVRGQGGPDRQRVRGSRAKTLKAPRRLWSQEEDAALLDAVARHPNRCWKSIAACVPGRTLSQCNARYLHYLDPTVLHEPYTPEEDECIISAYMRMGPRWAALAHFLPGRTGHGIKNRWQALQIRVQNMPAPVPSSRYIAPVPATQCPAAEEKAPVGCEGDP
ncbi:hypothetical protein KFE25_004968 [Diacronema lutheri]|uniref:Uncharacterized protein n=2 Tax=Diacronema lutheri TaxID=2081491 RepID=A0A8J5XKY8_DIALT|nr:hypothetical protein KFE25_004968 [Diacronema lutheri]